MDYRGREDRTVRMGPHEHAVHRGGDVWDVERSAPGRAARLHGTLLTADVLERVRDDDFEHERALRIAGR